MHPSSRLVGWLFAPLLLVGGSSSASSQSSPQATTSRQLTLSAIIPFSAIVGTSSASQTLTLTNSGHTSITISSISLSDTVNYSITSSCAGSKKLSVKKTCLVIITFHPQTAASLPATITITDNATGSPQIVSLIGTGTTTAVTRTLYTFPETDLSVTPLYALVNGAQKTIDMTMYALSDTTFTDDLIADCKRGVVVRVILDQNLEKSRNTPAYTSLNAQTNCSAV